MSGFSVDWLALREPADRAARAAALIERLRSAGPRGGAWRIVDLGSGTGANLRYLAPRLGGRQDWLLVDDDAALLAHAASDPASAPPLSAANHASPPAGAATENRVPVERPSGAIRRAGPRFGTGTDKRVPAECRVHRARLDLATALTEVAWPAEGLVTASALLDLVSDGWLEALTRQASDVRADVLFALTYDGRIDFSPAEPEDARVRALVNAHQRRDKSFGPALGPAAAEAAVRRFEAAGYAVETAPSDWRLEPGQQALQEALIEGWRSAAAEIAPENAAQLDEWRARRLAHVAAGVSRLVVGHVDLLGFADRNTRTSLGR